MKQEIIDIEVVSIDDLIQDDHNFNKGNEQGAQLLERSFRECGAGRSVLIDKDNQLPYIPNPDQIKSVYAAAGILSSMNEKTDSDHLMALWADLKAMHQRYKIGVDVGGGDDHSPEPPSFEESQGESGTNKA